MTNRELRLERMNLQNYRCFSSLEIGFHERMTVIVGRNGRGKTAVLDAIAVALGPFVGAFDSARGVHFAAQDVRQVRNPNATIAEMESQYPLRMEVSGLVDGRSEEWTRELAGAKSHTSYGDARALIDYGKHLQRLVRDNADGRNPNQPTLPLISYYGTGRLWSEKRLTLGKKSTEATSRISGYTDCLDSSSRYRIFSDWFERLCRTEFEERESAQKLSEVQTLLRAIRSAVDTVLQPSGWGGITFKSSEKGIVAEHPLQGTLPVEWLSDGIRNLIGLTADIAHRAVRLNSHLAAEAVLQTPGIVLIDEVDMHLHPEWQQVILDALQVAFQSIQFIVTTHSPQVVSTVHKESVRILRQTESGWKFDAPEFQTRGVESTDVLSRIMEVDPVPRVDEAAWLAAYRALIETDESNSPAAIDLRARLLRHFGDRHPLVLDCDRLLRFQAFKQRRAPSIME